MLPSAIRLISLEGFAALHSLRELDVSHNGIQSMLGLVSNKNLRALRISHNRIRRIEGLEKLTILEEVRTTGYSPQVYSIDSHYTLSSVFANTDCHEPTCVKIGSLPRDNGYEYMSRAPKPKAEL